MERRVQARSGLDAVVEREREAALRRGVRLLGWGAALVPIALIDRAYAVSDQLLVRIVDMDLDPAAIELGAVGGMVWFALIGGALAWRLRVDEEGRRWMAPALLAVLLYASWRFGLSPAVVLGLGLSVLGFIYLRDAACPSG